MASMNTEMDHAIVELANAQDSLAQAASRIVMARTEETECLNRVNKAQKKLDELVGALKKQAPRDSDWHRASRPGQPVIG